MLQKHLVFVALFAFSATSAYAAEYDLPGPGILPTSPLYRLEQIFERIGLFITFDPEQKAQRILLHAEERLAEVVALADKGEFDKSTETLAVYEATLDETTKEAKEAQAKGSNIDEVMERVSEVTFKHQSVLADVYDKVPDNAKSAIEKAMEKSLSGHENAMEAISGEKKEEVEQMVEKSRQEVEDHMESLKKEGKDIPEITLPPGIEKNIEEGKDVRGIQSPEFELPEQVRELPEKAQKIFDDTKHP